MSGRVNTMRLLVLGGTRFVGRAVIDEALARDWQVTALHRGVTGTVPDGAAVVHADRTDPAALDAALGAEEWDAVLDTWSGAPAVATAAAARLRAAAKRYCYVSTLSVYEWGSHTNEESPVVDGDPAATDGDYAAIKRGAELGVLASFPHALVARPGLILGPHEDIGRLPWWLDRISRGGRVVAPGRPERRLQYVDARDLARWALAGLESGLTGPFDIISPSGHATTHSLLSACVAATGSDAQLVWVPEQRLADAGAKPWTHLPCWVPEHGEFAGFLESDTSKAVAHGLVCRPVEETVRDTWAWLCRDGFPEQHPQHGLPADLERQLLGG